MPVLPPAVLLKSTSTPTAVFSLPVLLAIANAPIAVLKLPSRIGIQGECAIGRVFSSCTVAKKRLRPGSCVEAASGVAKKRERSVGRVSSPSVVA